MKKLFLIASTILSLNANAVVITTSAWSTPPNGCRSAHHCEIRGYHDIDIYNDTETSHTYSYSYQMCVTIDGYNNCENIGNTITVTPWQHWTNHRDNLLSPVLYDNASYFVVTSVVGERNVTTRNNYVAHVK
jgi:hypothetical protein